jgi:tight adherence protein B
MTGAAQRTALVVLVAAVALLLVSATPGPSQPEGRIVSSTQDDNSVTYTFTADGLAPGVTIDPETARVIADEIELPTDAEAIDGGETTPQRTAVLVIDVSSSMRGDRLEAAQEAALAYIDVLSEAGVYVGLVTFAGEIGEVIEPTDDYGRISSEIRDLETSRGTALHDGVIAGVDLASVTEGTASVLLLSDGEATGGVYTLDEAVARVGAAGLHLDAVAIGEAERESLDRIAGAGGGGVVDASADLTRLVPAFEQAASAIANQVLITAEILPAVAGRDVVVEVSAQAGEDTVRATGSGVLGEPAAAYGAQPVPHEGFVPTTWLLAGLGALFLGLAPLLGVALARATSSVSMQGKVRRRLSVYTLSGRKAVKREETTVSQAPIARQAVGLADRIVRERDFESLLAARLDSAGLSLRPAEWLLIHVGTALGSGLLLLLLSGLQIVPAMLGVVLGVAGPFIFLLVKASRRRSVFLAQLPETLQLMAGSLSAGYSLPQAVDTVMRDGTPPMSTELNRALVESRLGVPIEDALDGVADRMVSKDFAWVIMAIRIQRQVGGNLAELLTTVAATLRERERLRRQVHALSAEGRLSAWILGALPIGFALYLIVARGSYLQPLWTDPLGWSLLLLGVVLMVGGALWLRKVVRVEV